MQIIRQKLTSLDPSRTGAELHIQLVLAAPSYSRNSHSLGQMISSQKLMTKSCWLLQEVSWLKGALDKANQQKDQAVLDGNEVRKLFLLPAELAF